MIERAPLALTDSSRSHPSTSNLMYSISIVLVLASRSGNAWYSETQQQYTLYVITNWPASFNISIITSLRKSLSETSFIIHCIDIKIGMRSFPSFNERSAFPITEPKALIGSEAFIACPTVGDVVSKSPTSIGE